MEFNLIGSPENLKTELTIIYYLNNPEKLKSFL